MGCDGIIKFPVEGDISSFRYKRFPWFTLAMIMGAGVRFFKLFTRNKRQE